MHLIEPRLVAASRIPNLPAARHENSRAWRRDALKHMRKEDLLA